MNQSWAVISLQFAVQSDAEFFTRAAEVLQQIERLGVSANLERGKSDLFTRTLAFDVKKAAVATLLPRWEANKSLHRIGASGLGTAEKSLRALDAIQESFFENAKLAGAKSPLNRDGYQADHEVELEKAYTQMIEILTNEFDWMNVLTELQIEVIAAAMLSVDAAHDYVTGSLYGNFPHARDVFSLATQYHSGRITPNNLRSRMKGQVPASAATGVFAPVDGGRDAVLLQKRATALDYLYGTASTRGIWPEGYAYRKMLERPDWAPRFQLVKDGHDVR